MSLEIGMDHSSFCPPQSGIRDRRPSDADYIEKLQQLEPMISPQFQTPSLSFALGIALGAKIGFWVLCSMAAIVQVMCGMRTERLLIRYYGRQCAGEVWR